VSRTPIDGHLNQEIVLGHLMEGIGIANWMCEAIGCSSRISPARSTRTPERIGKAPDRNGLREISRALPTRETFETFHQERKNHGLETELSAAVAVVGTGAIALRHRPVCSIRCTSFHLDPKLEGESAAASTAASQRMPTPRPRAIATGTVLGR